MEWVAVIARRGGPLSFCRMRRRVVIDNIVTMDRLVGRKIGRREWDSQTQGVMTRLPTVYSARSVSGLKIVIIVVQLAVAI